MKAPAFQGRRFFAPRAASLCHTGLMATLHLICGLPGAGKSTLAAVLERDRRALRLTPDDWIASLFGGDGRDPDTRLRIEALQFDMALRALSLGLDVVLDNGFWHRSERDAARVRAAAIGADTRLYFMDVPREELKRRLAIRNRNLPANTFVVTAEDIDAWWDLIERPGPDEPGFTTPPDLASRT